MSYFDDNHSSSVSSLQANGSEEPKDGNNARAIFTAQGSSALQESIVEENVGISPLAVPKSLRRGVENYAGRIVLTFMVVFVLLLLGMHFAGQMPGESFLLKATSDFMQLAGELIGLFLCGSVALRFRAIWLLARQHATDGDEAGKAEMQIERRFFLAWSFLAMGIAFYAIGQAIWTSYDIRMLTSQIPFPGLYDLSFSGSYPFFLVGTLLLNQQLLSHSDRTRLLLDALSIIGAAFALSWFFVLGPTIANLNNGLLDRIIGLYFPVGDLFLVVVATLSLINQFPAGSLLSPFIRLCSGLAVLAVTDSLLVFFVLSSIGFGTGTFQDLLWPLSMMLMGLAAVEFLRSRSRQVSQVQIAGLYGLPHAAPQSAPGRPARKAQFGMILRTVAPFVLDLLTCTILLTVITPRGGIIAIQSSLVALGLILLVIVRQSLTLIENSRLRAQLQGELVVSRKELHLTHQEALTDAITGLPNHRAVMDWMGKLIAASRRTGEPCAVLFIDLDHFKHVNDIWGHQAGDSILLQVAERLRGVIREEDFVGRYGGEEFAAVLTNSDIRGAALAAERMRFAIASPPCIWQIDAAAEPVSLKITGSIGIAVYGEHGDTREMLIERADSAMYFAKRNGRNRACIADSEEMQAAQHISDPTQTTEIRTAQVLTVAASARDYETGEHAHRLVLLAEAVARHLHQPEEELHLIRLGALLHDIGKIGIPDGILHKPGPLNADEWVIMRRHPEIGHQILSMAGGVSQALAIIVLAHHERYDGKGYPHGISGEDIPIAARILSVIDAFDAMTSRRPYREPIPYSDACKELRRCAGAQFDPGVVDAFCYVVEVQGALAVR